MDPLWQKYIYISSMHVAVTTKLFFDNAVDPGNGHTKFEIHLIYY